MGVDRYRKSKVTLAIYKHIINLIDSGELKSGDKLPTSVELQRKFLTSSNCVASASKILQHEGRIKSVNTRHFKALVVVK